MGNYYTANELYGIKVFTDNRIKRGKLLPYKDRTDSFRCSQKTLDMIKHYIDRQEYDEMRQRMLWAVRYGHVLEKPKSLKVMGITA